MQEQQKGQQQHTQNFRCKECGKILNSSEELREHEKSHQAQGQQSHGQQGQGQQGQGQQSHGQPGQGGTTHKAGGGGA